MKNKLNIGFVLDDTLDTPDGVQQYVLTLGKWFSARGHSVHYLVGDSKRTDIKNVHSMARNVRVRFNQNRLSIPLPTKKSLVSKKLKELNLDVIHVQMPYSPLFAGRVISSAPSTTKIIGTFHIVMVSWLHEVGARGLELINRRSLKHFDNIVSVSPAAAKFAKTVFGIESQIVPNAVDISQFKIKPIQTKVPHIVYLGRLVERKGCMWLLKALKQLQDTYEGEYKVTIAGKGPLKDRLYDYVTMNCLKNVKFIGFVEEKDKPKLLASADIAVFPSTGGESFGIVLIEAMAAGARVVIGGNNVGYSSVLETNKDLLVDPTDTKMFAARLKFFLESNNARIMASKWASSNVKQYDVNVVGKKILAIYNNSNG